MTYSTTGFSLRCTSVMPYGLARSRFEIGDPGIVTPVEPVEAIQIMSVQKEALPVYIASFGQAVPRRARCESIAQSGQNTGD